MLRNGQENISLYVLATGERFSWLPPPLFLQAFLLVYNLLFLAPGEHDAQRLLNPGTVRNTLVPLTTRRMILWFALFG